MKNFLILILLLGSGCVSQVLPPSTDDIIFKIDQPVYIHPSRHEVYRKSLAKALERAEVFTEVKMETVDDPEVFRAKVHRRVSGSAVIPFFTFISLGIIPTIVEEEFGESFYLNYEGKQYKVEATWKGNTILGWLAVVMNVLPGRTMGSPEESRRFERFLKSKIKDSLPKL